VTVVSIVVGALILVAMIGIALYGAATLPSDARVPIHYGIGSYNNFAPKTVGLIMWPAGGALIYGIFVAISAHALKPNHGGGSGSAPLIIMLFVLALACAFEWGAISVARRNTTVRSQ
jgi:hypothetical protein